MTTETYTAPLEVVRNHGDSDAKTTWGRKTTRNQVQATEAKDEAKEVVYKGGVSNDVANNAGASTAQNTHHQFVTSREKEIILAQS